MRWYITIITIICLGTSGYAQKAPTPLSLSQAIQAGLRNNFQMQVADQDIKIAQNNNHWGATSRYPTVDFNLNAPNSYSVQNQAFSFVTGNFNSFNTGITASVDLSWTLFDGYQARINKQRLEELERQSQGAAAIVVENTIRNIILAYYQVLIDGEQLEVLQEVLDLSRDRVEYQKIRKEYGQGGTFDILQSQDAYLNDSTNILIQENTYATSMRNLNLAIGEKDFNKVYDLTDSLEYRSNAYDFNTLQRKMLSNNKQLQNLQIVRSLSRIERNFQESLRKPRLSIGSGISQNFNAINSNAVNFQDGEEFGWASGNASTAYLNFTATYNLYDAGNRKRNIESARMEEIVNELEIEDLRRNLGTELKNTLEVYNNQRQLLRLTEDLIENARQNLNIADERFRAGQINSFDYRTIQLAYINASQSRLNAIFNLKNTDTELTRLTGGLVR
ncbi:MAG: TolC family protein [Bacteroidota bacterium]